MVGLVQVRDPKKRLGHRGAAQVKAHPWFAGVDWDKIYKDEPAFVPAFEVSSACLSMRMHVYLSLSQEEMWCARCACSLSRVEFCNKWRACG